MALGVRAELLDDVRRLEGRARPPVLTKLLHPHKALVAAAVTVGVGVAAATGFGQTGRAPVPVKPSDPITAPRYVLTVDGYELASRTRRCTTARAPRGEARRS